MIIPSLKRDGSVWAWGYNIFGQLGDGTKINRSTPVRVKGLGEVIAIAGGYHQTVMLKRDGTVWATGYGLLGDGPSSPRAGNRA